MSYSLMLSSQVPPEETIGVARLAERTGFSRIWLTEDYYRKAAFASCAAVLGATSHLTVGLGVASLYLRHPTTLAREIATLHRMFGVSAGVGLGLWALNNSNRMPALSIRSIRERLAVLSDLLAGKVVSVTDEFGHRRKRLSIPLSLTYPLAGCRRAANACSRPRPRRRRRVFRLFERALFTVGDVHPQ